MGNVGHPQTDYICLSQPVPQKTCLLNIKPVVAHRQSNPPNVRVVLQELSNCFVEIRRNMVFRVNYFFPPLAAEEAKGKKQESEEHRPHVAAVASLLFLPHSYHVELTHFLALPLLHALKHSFQDLLPVSIIVFLRSEMKVFENGVIGLGILGIKGFGSYFIVGTYILRLLLGETVWEVLISYCFLVGLNHEHSVKCSTRPVFRRRLPCLSNFNIFQVFGDLFVLSAESEGVSEDEGRRGGSNLMHLLLVVFV